MKRTIFFVFKVFIATGLIAVLLKLGRLDFSAVQRLRLDFSTLAWILVGVVAVAVGNGFTAVRLQALLQHAGMDVAFLRVLGIAFAGAFVGYVLPGLVLGDAFKAAYLYGDAPGRKAAAVVMVLLDRAIGLFSFLLLSSLSLLLGLAVGYVSSDLMFLLVIPAVAAIMILAGYLFGKYGRRWIRPTRIGRLPIVSYVSEGFDILRDYFSSFPLVLRTVVYSLINDLLIITSFIIAARLIGNHTPVYAHFILDPIAMVGNAIPITPGGLGITESAFSLLYQAIGSAEGAMLGITGRLFQYAAYVSGGAISIILLGAKTSIVRTNQVEREGRPR